MVNPMLPKPRWTPFYEWTRNTLNNFPYARNDTFKRMKMLLAWKNIVRDRFLYIFLRTHWGNSLKFGAMVYRDHLQNWLDFGHSLLIFFLLVALWLSELVKVGVSVYFLENAWEESLEIWCADVFWPHLELITFWPQSVDFPPFGSTLI